IVNADERMLVLLKEPVEGDRAFGTDGELAIWENKHRDPVLARSNFDQELRYCVVGIAQSNAATVFGDDVRVRGRHAARWALPSASKSLALYSGCRSPGRAEMPSS